MTEQKHEISPEEKKIFELSAIKDVCSTIELYQRKISKASAVIAELNCKLLNYSLGKAEIRIINSNDPERIKAAIVDLEQK